MQQMPQGMSSLRVLTAGTRLGRYTIIERLAAGGMAELYLAQVTGPRGFRKLVAVKIVLPHLSTEPEFIAMFLNEAKIAAGLEHPHIASVVDLGCVQGEYFIAMEYVRGPNLRQLLDALPAGERLPLGCALTIVTAAASALHHAHEQVDEQGRPLELVHRDVSLTNVLVDRDGAVKLVDFGIAKATARTSMTEDGVLKGKIGYMSPEQCRGEPVGRRSDIFALGIVAYELTTGRRLFSGPNQFAVLNKTLAGEFVPPSELDPDYPPALERIVLRALAFEPEARHDSAWDLQAELEAFAHDHGLMLSSQALAQLVNRVIGPPAPVAWPDDDDVATTVEPMRSRFGSGSGTEPSADSALITRVQVSTSLAGRARRRPALVAGGLTLSAVLGIAAFGRGSGELGEGGRSPDPESAAAPAAASASAQRELSQRATLGDGVAAPGLEAATSEPRAMASGGEASGLGGEATAPGGEATAPGGEATTPGGEAMTPGGGATTPGGGTPGGEGTTRGGEGAPPESSPSPRRPDRASRSKTRKARSRSKARERPAPRSIPKPTAEQLDAALPGGTRHHGR